jgi:1-deoxy-D-xylulose-5-phosphate reductoisomerase
VAPLNLAELAALSFSEPDFQRFPCLALAFSAAKSGGLAPTVLNAANEIAVASFLDGGLPYLQIPVIVEKTLNAIQNNSVDSLEVILEVDAHARRVARDFIGVL